MERYVNILYQLARFLAGIPPELLGAIILVVLVRPDLLVAVFLYVLNAVVGDLISNLLWVIFLIYVWSRLSPQKKQAVKAFLEKILPSRVLHHLGITTNEEPRR